MANLKGEIVEMNTSPGCKDIKECGHVGMGFLSSRLSGGQASGSMDSDRKHRSTLAFENSSRCLEADIQSSPVKSETSTETHLTPVNGSFEMDAGRTQDGLKTTMHDSQHTTESSCSNSSVVVPVPFSNQSYQEASREAYLFRNCGSSMDSSNSKTFDCSREEPASSESGVSAQIARKARRNTNVRNSVKVLAMDGNHSSSMISKGEREISHNWDDETEVEVLEKTNDVKCFSPNDSMKGKLLEMDKSKDESWVIESADSSMTKCGKKSVEDQDKVVGFDLNEDITPNELDDSFHPVVASVSSSAIQVVAKVGLPRGRPMRPLKFEGGLGWKGTAETSAFHPTARLKNLDGETCSRDERPKETERFTGIDLNVALVEDTCHSEDDQKQGKSHWIDLNCLYDAADDSTQPIIQPKSEDSPLVDLNLDTSTSRADRSNNAHWPGHVYFADLRTMQHMANNSHTFMASPHILHSMEAMQRVAPQTLPPHSYSTNAPFHFGSRDHPLPSRYYHDSNTFPGSVHNSYNTLTKFLHEQSSGSVSAYAPKFDGKNNDGPRLFPFLSQDSTLREQDSWFGASLKRKEREGGEECDPLGYKQLI